MPLFIFLFLLTLTLQGPYSQYYKQAYKIAIAMNVDQKIGQILQVDFNAFASKTSTDQKLAEKLHLGSLLVGGDGTVDANGNMVFIPDKEYQDREIYTKSKLENWQKLAQKFNYTMSITTGQGKTYDIRPLLGTDAVHGNQHVSGAILFPHNTGLACSHNAQNFYNAGYWTGKSVKQAGFNYAFAPTVAVSHNPAWGRFYQTMGQQEDYIRQFAKRFTQGLQGENLKSGVIGSAKHFYGDGATLYGADQGNAIVSSYKSFQKHNTQGYVGSIQAGVASVMVSYSAINWIPNSISPNLNRILRDKLKFDGFLISDYDQVTKVKSQGLPTDLFTVPQINMTVAMILNAGIDMLMIPGYKGTKQLGEAINGIKYSLQQNYIWTDRLDDAVARILSVKLALGVANLKTSLNQQPVQTPKPSAQPQVKLTTQYQDSLQAVQQSLVLLKNDNKVLPAPLKDLSYIVLVGQRLINIHGAGRSQLFRSYDDIGMQNGGWTLRWQGFLGNSQWQGDNRVKSNASSILDALKGLNGKAQLLCPNYTSYNDDPKINRQRTDYLKHLKEIRSKMNAQNTLILAVIGQSPYAQMKGDIGVPFCMNDTILGKDGCLYDDVDNNYLPTFEHEDLNLDFAKFDKEVIDQIRGQDKKIPIVTVLLSGRPMVVAKPYEQSNAFVAAWLPGTSGGQGIVNALTGAYRFRPNGSSDRRNTLAFDWPKTWAALKNFPVYKADGQVPRIPDRLHDVGHGLSTATNDIIVQM